MCTVSFIALQDQYIITSNRDENIERPAANMPETEKIKGYSILYPKDPKAGGTWFALNQNGTVAVLLNGAFEKHIHRNNYSISRGIILLEIISNPTPIFCFEKLNLTNVEPFTIILFEYDQLIELRWDAAQKHRKQLSPNGKYIWSSVTLYSPPAIQKRKKLFDAFIANDNDINAASIIQFHSNHHNDCENGFVINRNNGLKTFSITQAIISKYNLSMSHHDLLHKQQQTITIPYNELRVFNE
ncbi:MAG: NRDE family protein [Bacteroidota bacterium]|nr:NRDE family protein [Bacteroidota bacterium]